MRRLIPTLALVAGCAAPATDEFVAIESDFADFRSWERRVPTDDDGVPEAIYGNDAAHAGATYPLGTILVAADELGPPQAWRIHAMVKRGGAYNPDADGWEWLELYVDEDDVPRVLWRGEHAPSGAGYGDASAQDCVECHSDRARDRVIGWSSISTSR